MKTFAHRQQNGAVMVFAVLLMTAGIFVLAAVLQLAATQGISGDEEWTAVKRRVTLLNSRAMAREHLLTRLFRAPQQTDNWPVTFNNDFGAFEIMPKSDPQSSYWATESVNADDVVLNINPFNLLERGGFYREVFEGKLSDGQAGSTLWSFALRTRSPVAAGYCFVQQRPADNPLAEYAAPPYIDMEGTNEQFFGFYGLPRMPVASVDGVMTRGTGDANGYQGYLDVPEGEGTPNWSPFTGTSYEVRDVDALGKPTELQLVLDLSEPDPNEDTPVVRIDVGLTEDTADYEDANGVLHPDLPVTAIVLDGTDDELLKSLHVVVLESNTNLRILTLRNNNVRRVYFYRSKSPNIGAIFDVNSIDADSWRLGITMSQCNIQFDITGNLEIKGGLRTDGEIIFQQGNIAFVPEDSPRGLDYIADRMMWLEDYRAQQ